MGQKDTPGQHWDREQWAPDTEGRPAGPQDEVWDRSQMQIDDTGTDADALRRTDVDVDASDGVDPGLPDMEGISGRGQPSGESHWERTEHESDR